MSRSDALEYIVWRSENETADEGRKYIANEPRSAAVQAAFYDHARGGWEWTWPIDYVVSFPPTGKKWLVNVERETVPEFSAGTPKEIK